MYKKTHRGLYKFDRLASGVKATPVIFQKFMDTILSGPELAITYLDDILMNSQSAEQNKSHVYEVFKRIQDSN